MTIERYNYNDEPSGRSETLVQALDRCERLEKQLRIAKKAINGAISRIRGCEAFTAKNYLQRAKKQIKELEK